MNVITHKGVNYVNWTVKGQEVHDVFFVQRSIDESEFETVDFVLGLGVNPSLVLGYSYIDESPPLGSIRYRIKIIGKDQMVLHSKFVAVIVKVPARNPLAHTLIFP